jgi:hypothetical protein
MSRAVRYITRQLVDLIPKIYDTQRVARIVGIDGEIGMVKINPTQPEAVRVIKDPITGETVDKIYNPNVGLYDVMVTTGPSYMTKRQEAMDGMSMILQSNPQLWSVAGDLFIKNMDWPGAQEMAARFARILDPKVLEKTDESPEAQMMRAQMNDMANQMEQTTALIQQLQQSYDMQKLAIDEQNSQIKAYEAETKRIQVTQPAMTPEQIQDIVQGTIAAAIDMGDIVPDSAPIRGEIEGMA